VHASPLNFRSIPEWGALYRSWVAFTIAKNQYDFEKMTKYAIVIRKFQRRLNIEISDFPDVGIVGFEENFENKEEDDDSKLATIDPWSGSLKEGKDDDSYPNQG
jgi:hypothetical protein